MRRRYKVSFAPLKEDAKGFLSWVTGSDYVGTDFTDPELWFCCTVRDAGAPVIVIVFEFKSPHDAHFTLAVTDARGLSRQLITTLYRTVFSRAARITALVTTDNTQALKQVWRMGFRQEGYMRRGYDPVRDATLWGLLPEDCPYLRGRPFRYRVIQQTHDIVERMQ